MTREQKYLNDLMHDIRVLIKSDPNLMRYATIHYHRGLTTLDELLRYAGTVGAAYRENGLGIDGKERKDDTN